MSKRIKFHLDENVSNAVAQWLRRRGISVTTTAEEGLISASDEDQLAFAKLQDCVIFTHDDDFLRLHRSGVAHTGITYCRQSSRSTGEIIKTLSLLWEYISPADIAGQVEFI